MERWSRPAARASSRGGGRRGWAGARASPARRGPCGAAVRSAGRQPFWRQKPRHKNPKHVEDHTVLMQPGRGVCRGHSRRQNSSARLPLCKRRPSGAPGAGREAAPRPEDASGQPAAGAPRPVGCARGCGARSKTATILRPGISRQDKRAQLKAQTSPRFFFSPTTVLSDLYHQHWTCN